MELIKIRISSRNGIAKSDAVFGVNVDDIPDNITEAAMGILYFMIQED